MKLNNKEKLNFIRNLGVMLSAGIPILKALDSLHKGAKGKEKIILKSIIDDINQGKTLSTALNKYSGTFDPITVNLIKASEESGNLDTTLKDVAEEIKKDIEFIDKVKSALMYPLFVFILFVVVFLIILTYVIPRISEVFSKLNVVLPLPTKILIIISDTFLAYYPQIILGIVVLSTLLVIWYKIKRRAVLDFVFSAPLLSTLANQIDITRVTKTLALLLSSGITITKALDLAESVAARKDMMKALRKANKEVSEGKPLSEPLSKFEKVFPSLALRFIEAGEQSGTLEQSMEQLSKQYEEEVGNTLKRLTTLLEPVMLVVLGAFVGGIMLSIIAPIYQLIGNISPR